MGQVFSRRSTLESEGNGRVSKDSSIDRTKIFVDLYKLKICKRDHWWTEGPSWFISTLPWREGGKIKWFVVLIEKKFDPRTNGQETDVILGGIFDQGEGGTTLTASQRIFAFVSAQGIKDQQSFENHHRHSKHDRWRVEMSARWDETNELD